MIAVYNALAALNGGPPTVTFPALLAIFEKKGILLDGYFGTSPDYIEAYLQTEYDTQMLSGRQIHADALNRLSEEYTAYILTAYNNKCDITAEIHTMCITNDAGVYRFHNGDQRRTCRTLAEAVQGYHSGDGRAICVIGIRKRQKEELR